MTFAPLTFDGKTFIPTRTAVELSGYSSDYVGQLCRAGKLECKMIGRLWYVAEDSLKNHLKFIETLNALRSGGSISTAPSSVAEAIQSKPIAPDSPRAPSVATSSISEAPSELSPVRLTEAHSPTPLAQDAPPVDTAPSAATTPNITETVPTSIASPTPSPNLISRIGESISSVSPNNFFSEKFARASARFADKISRAIPILQNAAQGGAQFLTHALSFPGLRAALITSLVSGGAVLGGAHVVTLPAIQNAWNDTRVAAESLLEKIAAETATLQNESLANVSASIQEKIFSFATATAPYRALARVPFDLALQTAGMYARTTRDFLGEKIHGPVASLEGALRENGAALGGLIDSVTHALKRLARGVYGGISKVIPRSPREVATKGGEPQAAPFLAGENPEATPAPEGGTQKAPVSSMPALAVRSAPPPLYLSTGLSESVVNEKLSLLSSRLESELASLKSSQSAVQKVAEGNTTYINNVYNTVAGTNKLDQAANLLLDNPTIHYGTASNLALTSVFGTFTSLSGGNLSLTSSLQVGGDLAVIGTLTPSVITATSSISAPYFIATSTSATSTYAGGVNIQNGKVVIESTSPQITKYKK